MKKQLILSGIILLSSFSLQTCLGGDNVDGNGYYTKQIRQVKQAIGRNNEDLIRSMDPLEHMATNLDADPQKFLSDWISLEYLSKSIHQILSPIKRFENKWGDYYFPVTNCTYFHIERKPIDPNSKIATPLIDITTTLGWQISLKCNISPKQKIKFNFAQQYWNVLAPSDNPELYNRIMGKDGLVDYITKDPQNDPQKRRFPKTDIETLGQLLAKLDFDPDNFLNGYGNIHAVEDKLNTFIASIDLFELPGNVKTSEIPKDFDRNILYYPNSKVVEMLLNIAKEFDYLVKERQAGISVHETYNGAMVEVIEFGY
jgi:hypothetical protein